MAAESGWRYRGVAFELLNGFLRNINLLVFGLDYRPECVGCGCWGDAFAGQPTCLVQMKT